MSVSVTIEDNGRIEAVHCSGRVLWSFSLDNDDEALDSESIANELYSLLR
jgi:hypothetical protein